MQASPKQFIMVVVSKNVIDNNVVKCVINKKSLINSDYGKVAKLFENRNNQVALLIFCNSQLNNEMTGYLRRFFSFVKEERDFFIDAMTCLLAKSRDFDGYSTCHQLSVRDVIKNC